LALSQFHDQNLEPDPFKQLDLFNL